MEKLSSVRPIGGMKLRLQLILHTSHYVPEGINVMARGHVRITASLQQYYFLTSLREAFPQERIFGILFEK